MLQVLRRPPSSEPVKTFADLVQKAMIANHLVRRGPSASSVAELIKQSRAQAEMVTEGDKSFLNVPVLPRFM